MVYQKNRYGVTWNTVKSKSPTTIWFASKHRRDRYIVTDLLTNVVVIRSSICSHEKED